MMYPSVHPTLYTHIDTTDTFVIDNQITEENVKKEILELQKFEAMFSCPLVCKKGKDYDDSDSTDSICEVSTQHSSWNEGESIARECFSKVVPIAEKHACHVKQIMGTNK